MEINWFLKDICNKRFHALTHRDFRIFWLGQCVSLMGTWMQNIGMTWLVFSMTKSPFLLGLLETVGFLPFTLFSLFAGVIIDKYPKRKILLITQSIFMILALILSVLVFTHTARYEYIIIIAIISGFTNTIYSPARQTYTVEMTGREDLGNAIALSTLTGNLARVIGPTIGALVLASLGAGWCFLLNGISFMAVIASLLRIKDKPFTPSKHRSDNILGNIKDGLKYIYGEKFLLQIVLLITITGIFLYNYDILIPVFTKNILHGNEKIYGVLMSALGMGSLFGAIMISVKGKPGTTMKFLAGSALIEASLLIFISLTRTYYLTLIFITITGCVNILFSTAANTALQLMAKDEYRGRVMSVFSLVYTGTAPIGYMFAGTAAGRLGAGTTFFLCGVVTIVLIFIMGLILHRRT